MFNKISGPYLIFILCYTFTRTMNSLNKVSECWLWPNNLWLVIVVLVTPFIIQGKYDQPQGSGILSSPLSLAISLWQLLELYYCYCSCCPLWCFWILIYSKSFYWSLSYFFEKKLGFWRWWEIRMKCLLDLSCNTLSGTWLTPENICWLKHLR